MKIKRIITIAVIIASAGFSYYHHREVRVFFIENYYRYVKKENLNTAIARAHQLYRAGEYAKLADYCEVLMLLHPDEKEIQQIAGMNYLKLGEKMKGAAYLLRSLDEKRSQKEIFTRAISALYEERLYTDIITELSKVPPGDDPALNYFYGVSLYHRGEPKKALAHLKKSEDEGNTDFELYYYMGIIYEGMNEPKKSLENLEEAYRLNRFHRETISALVRLYNRTKNYSKAARLLRRDI